MEVSMYSNNYGNSYGSNYGTSNSGCAGCGSCDSSVGFLLVIILLAYVAIAFMLAMYIGRKAERNGHSFAWWTFLGFIFGLIALIALHVAIVAEDEGHSFILWAVLGFIFNIIALIALQTGLIAERKHHDFTSYVIIGSLFGIIALFIVCFLPVAITEPLKKVTATPKKETEPASKLLESSKATNIVATATTSQSQKWTCPACGQLNVSSAKNCINCYAEKPKN